MRAASHRSPQLWGETEKSPVTRADIDDFAFWAMIGILIGGRLGYILFYTIPYEPQKLFGPDGDLLFILRMWEGGMSFHGGLIGAALAVLYTSQLAEALRAPPRRRRLRRGADRALSSAASPTSSTANSTAARPRAVGDALPGL